MTATKVPARATIRGLLFDSTAIESVSKSLRDNEQVRSALGGIARLSTTRLPTCPLSLPSWTCST